MRLDSWDETAAVRYDRPHHLRRASPTENVRSAWLRVMAMWAGGPAQCEAERPSQ